jgi:hypothetical protein
LSVEAVHASVIVVFELAAAVSPVGAVGACVSVAAGGVALAVFE